MIDAIYKRRSIRKFLRQPVPDDVIRTIIEAGTWAPSAKNKQPWKFVVIRGKERRDMVRLLKKGILKARKGEGIFVGYDALIPSAIYTARVLEQSPAVIFILNTEGTSIYKELTPAEKVMELTNQESVSAAIQNMALAAADLGLGSLWTCNIFCAYDELKEWLGEEGEMMAALAIGYTDQDVRPLPRKSIDDIIVFRGRDEEEA